MVVCKFGGAVLATPGGFQNMASILRGLGGEPVVVVVSALGPTTRLLDRAIEASRQGDTEGARAAVAELVQVHTVCFDTLGLNGASETALRTLLAEQVDALQRVLHGIATTRQCTDRVRDRVLSWGEHVAREITVQWFRSILLPAISVPARSVLVTSDVHGAAQPLLEATTRHATEIIAPLLTPSAIVVVEGFVGQSTSGDITTMGRESSNLTATVLGAALGARMITIYTDVEGVQSADPHVLSNTVARPHLSYGEARNAADSGMKLLYPTMMEPAESAGIPICIASAFAPDGSVTIIDSHHTDDTKPMVVHVDLGNGLSRCSTLNVDPAVWLSAIHSMLSTFHDLGTFDVITHHALRRADVIVATTHAVHVIEHLHSTLCR